MERSKSNHLAFPKTIRSQVVFPVPLGPKRKKECCGKGNNRVYMVIILTAILLYVYTKILPACLSQVSWACGFMGGVVFPFLF